MSFLRDVRNLKEESNLRITTRLNAEDPPPSTLSSQPPQVSLSIVLPRASEAEEAVLVQDEPDRVGPLQIGFGRAVPADYRGDLAARLEWFSGGETDVEDGPLNAALLRRVAVPRPA